MTVGVRAVFSILPFRYMLYFNDIICRWYEVFQSLLNCSCMWIPDVWEGFHDRSDLQLFQLVFVSVREKIEIKTNTDTVEPPHNGLLGDRRRWPLWGGRGVVLWCLLYCIFFFSGNTTYCLRADVSYFLFLHAVPFPRATKEIGDVCTQAIQHIVSSSCSL